MKGRSRTRRILKWVGLVGCLGVVLVFASTWFRLAEICCWANTDVYFIGTVPASLRYSAVYDVQGDWRFRDAESGIKITGVPPYCRDPENWCHWPRINRTRVEPAHGTVVVLPLWIVFLVIAIPTAFLWHHDRRPPKGHCQRCGYDLTGNESGTCPECGMRRVDMRTSRRMEKRRFGDKSYLVRLNPELLLLDDAADRIVVYRRAYFAFVRSWRCWLWLAAITAALITISEALHAARAELPPAWAIGELIVVWSMAGFGGYIWVWLGQNQMRASIRRQLRDRGVPVRLGCGYDLTGNESGTCPECGEAMA
jgi:predicted RNA-binding Zn-ribbon protein involved in translation (DUF1610 family)